MPKEGSRARRISIEANANLLPIKGGPDGDRTSSRMARGHSMTDTRGFELNRAYCTFGPFWAYGGSDDEAPAAHAAFPRNQGRDRTFFGGACPMSQVRLLPSFYE